jgi:hypothetical protein
MLLVHVLRLSAKAQRSRELREFIRCEVPMPAAAPGHMQPRPHIVTVCEKLAAGRD